MTNLRAVSLLFILLLAATLAAQSTIPNPGPCSRTAIADGQWGAGNIWSPFGAPFDGSVVCIPAGRTVTIAGTAAGRPKWVRVDGTLQMSTTANTKLLVETLHIAPSGVLRIATAAARLQDPFTSEIIFIAPDAPIDPGFDPDQMSRGLIAEGNVQVFGYDKTYMVPVVGDVRANVAPVITLAATPVHWKAGDKVVLTGTTFRRKTGSTDETRTIQSISGNVVTLSSPLTFDHLRVSTINNSGQTVTGSLHLANLSRNVVFKSETPTAIYRRGHGFFRHKNTRIEYARFENLGRTDKSVKLDDFKVEAGKVVRGAATNRRGRYAVHIHETGLNPDVDLTPPTKVTGCVVDNTPGWGFVNHSSYVDFRQNVAYDFTGAGFVTEDGDELGNFIENIAIRGKGDGKYRKDRLNFNNLERPQPIADFAFNGEGFWFQGPAIQVQFAIANSCNGAGIIWHTTGTVDPSVALSNPGTRPYGEYSYFPRGWIDNVYGSTVANALQPRLWNNGIADAVVISDLPILKCEDVESYGNLTGIRLRFNNHNNVDWYNEYGYEGHMSLAPGTTDLKQLPTRRRQAIRRVKLWNNETGLAIRYNAHTDWTDVTAMNVLDHDDRPIDVNLDIYAPPPSRNPAHGAEINFQTQSNTFTNLTIDGYEVAGWRTLGTRSMVITFTPPTLNYRNYTNQEAWNATIVLAEPGAQAPTLASTSATIRWTWTDPGTGSSPRFLVRYKPGTLASPNVSQQWKFATATGAARSVNVTGLTPNTDYVYQVIVGYGQDISTWTAVRTFKTTP